MNSSQSNMNTNEKLITIAQNNKNDHNGFMKQTIEQIELAELKKWSRSKNLKQVHIALERAWNNVLCNA